MHPFCRTESRHPGSRGWTPGLQGCLLHQPGWASNVTRSRSQEDADSFAHHCNPAKRPQAGRGARPPELMTGPAACGWRRRRRRKPEGSSYFCPGRAHRPGPGMAGLPGPHLCPPSQTPGGAGRGAGWRAKGAGARAGGGRSGVPGPPPASCPPQSIRVPPPHSARTQGRRAVAADECPAAHPSRHAVRRAWTRAGTSWPCTVSARPSRGEGGRPLLGRPREKPSPAQGGGPPAPSAALRPAPGPPLGPFVALRKSRPDCRARPWAFPGLSRRPGRWGENGCASLKTSLKTTPGPAALGSTPLPYPGHGRLGSRVFCTRRGRGGKEPASTNNQVLSALSGPPGEAPQSTGVPGPRPGA